MVLAVGLERYDYGAPMDLPDAAKYAVRFARWAHACGVPLEKIVLACSWLKEPPTPVLPGACVVDTTRDALDRTLHDLVAAGGDLLLLYWCGHGLLDENRSRVLFTSNATQVSKLNLPVDEILRLLASSSSEGTGFSQQILLLDACANYLEDMQFASGIPLTSLARGRPREVSQYVIYAADQGQIAEYDRMRRAWHYAGFAVAIAAAILLFVFLGWLPALGFAILIFGYYVIS